MMCINVQELIMGKYPQKSNCKDAIMAVLPLMPTRGTSVVLDNMREASTHSVGRNMALPQTYYWFYQQVRNHGPWDYKQQRRDLATLWDDPHEWDDPHDQFWIKQGIDYARQHGY